MTAPSPDKTGHADEMKTTTWSCERCTGRGEIEFARATPFFEVEAIAAKEHCGSNPDCRSQTIRLRLYDANRQLGAVKR